MFGFLKASNSPVFISINFLTLSHKDRWFPFSFHISSAISDFSISPRTTAYRCFSNLIFSGRHVSALYILPQQQGMEYIQFLIMLRYPRRVEPLVNIFLISYGLHIFWILSARPLTKGRHTVVSFRVSSSIYPGFLEPMLCVLVVVTMEAMF